MNFIGQVTCSRLIVRDQYLYISLLYTSTGSMIEWRNKRLGSFFWRVHFIMPFDKSCRNLAVRDFEINISLLLRDDSYPRILGTVTLAILILSETLISSDTEWALTEFCDVIVIETRSWTDDNTRRVHGMCFYRQSGEFMYKLRWDNETKRSTLTTM